jgi:type I restriction-modification system DNA methylase subunit
LINRLIFIRTAEDREVEDNRLRSLVRVLRDKKQINHLDRELAEVFRQFDNTYNSELSARHFSEELQIPPTDLEEVIEGLYEKNFTRYNFNALDADVLGTAYEQYLGHVVAEGVDETHVEEKRTKRKSQGIYYTPTFVTKYIVQQKAGKYLDEHGYNPSRPPRVLDMACGSGSFLIEAFDVIDNFVARQRGHAQKGEVDFYDRLRQLEVLQNCIFGVDKDKQAV